MGPLSCPVGAHLSCGEVDCLTKAIWDQCLSGRKVPTESLFEQEAPQVGTQKCSTKRGLREPLHVEFALNNREVVKAEVFEKRVFEQTTPFKRRKLRGAFSLNYMGLRQRSGEGVVRRNGCPKRVFLESPFLPCHLKVCS